MAAAALVMAACGGATRRSVPSIDALPSTNAPSLRDAGPRCRRSGDGGRQYVRDHCPSVLAGHVVDGRREKLGDRSLPLSCVSYCHTRETRVAGKSVWAAAGVVKRNAAVSAPGERTEHARRLGALALSQSVAARSAPITGATSSRNFDSSRPSSNGSCSPPRGRRPSREKLVRRLDDHPCAPLFGEPGGDPSSTATVTRSASAIASEVIASSTNAVGPVSPRSSAVATANGIENFACSWFLRSRLRQPCGRRIRLDADRLHRGRIQPVREGRDGIQRRVGVPTRGVDLEVAVFQLPALAESRREGCLVDPVGGGFEVPRDAVLRRRTRLPPDRRRPAPRGCSCRRRRSARSRPRRRRLEPGVLRVVRRDGHGRARRLRVESARKPLRPRRRPPPHAAGGTPIRASRPRGRFGRRPRSPRRTSARTRHCRRSRSGVGQQRGQHVDRRVAGGEPMPLVEFEDGARRAVAERRQRRRDRLAAVGAEHRRPPETPSVQRRASATTASSVDPRRLRRACRRL